MNTEDWLKTIDQSIAGFMSALSVPASPDRFLPCLKGRTPEGDEAALGFSCLALKIHCTLGMWDTLGADERKAWIAFLNSFQIEGRYANDPVTENAFVDPPVARCLTRKVPLRARLLRRIIRSQPLTALQRVLMAETKQAIATLAQVGAQTLRPYRGFPASPAKLRNYLEQQDWTKPWSAGAHLAGVSVFVTTEAPRLLPQSVAQELSAICRQFADTTANSATGAYHLGPAPDHGESINGAMKVLTALDWLEMQIHFPDQLIDTCLMQSPRSEGCHLVDAVYVLHRCALQSTHRRKEIQAFCRDLLEMIRCHFIEADGAFSYHVGRSQTSYYDVPISEGARCADIHGTVLLVWALSMIFRILEYDSYDWQVIRP